MTRFFPAVAALTLLFAGAATPQTAAPANVSAELTTKTALGAAPAALLVTIDPAASATPIAHIDVVPHVAGDAFSVSPAKWAIDNVTARVAKTFTITRVNRLAAGGDYKVLIDTTVRTSAGTISQTPTVVQTFTWKPELRVWAFFALGILGMLIGYLLRLIINVLKAVPAPSPAPPDAAAPADGPITRWVRSHYYPTDLIVTLVIGFFVLVALTKDGHPPENAGFWYTALGAGVGLGLLTNSELLTRMKV